jgi:hypothetical protein
LLAGPDAPVADRESFLGTLRESWDQMTSRQHGDDSEWTLDLAQYLTHLVDLRAAHVDRWLKSNVQRFQAGNSSIEELRRTFDSAIIDLRASVQLCRSQCSSCNLFCIKGGQKSLVRFERACQECMLMPPCRISLVIGMGGACRATSGKLGFN